MSKTLAEIHEDVPADHYDKGIKYNIFQKYWHFRRFSEVLKVVKPTSGSILDVGCHAGLFTQKVLNKSGSTKVYGVDISPKAIALAKKRIPFGHFQVADAHNLPYQSNFFDAVFCLEVLEHIDDPVTVISEIRRVLKKKGTAVLLVPTENLLFKFVWFLWTLYYHHWRHAHVQSFDNNKLDSLVKKLGFKILHTKLFNFDMLKLLVIQK